MKTESIYDHFINTDVSFLAVTETWMNNNNTERIVERLRIDRGLEILYKNRRNKKGGGVAIIFDPQKITITSHKFKSEKYELISGAVKTKKNERPIYVFCCYLPPSLTAGEQKRVFEVLSEEIVLLKSSKRDPYFIVVGDFNGFDTTILTKDFVDINMLASPPSRKDARLDLCMSNAELINAVSLPPLWSANNTSDHLSIGFELDVKQKHVFTLIERTSRTFSKKQEDLFVEYMNEIDWESELQNCVTSSAAAQCLTEVVSVLMDRCFPFKKKKIKSTDDPWITDPIRRVIKRRSSTFKHEGKSENYFWWKNLAEEMISGSKKAFYDREVDKICDNAGNKNAINYRALKYINCPEKPKIFSLNDISVGATEEEVMEEAADFYTKITEEFEQLKDEDVPRTYDRPLYHLKAVDIAMRIKKQNKKGSRHCAGRRTAETY